MEDAVVAQPINAAIDPPVATPPSLPMPEPVVTAALDSPQFASSSAEAPPLPSHEAEATPPSPAKTRLARKGPPSPAKRARRSHRPGKEPSAVAARAAVTAKPKRSRKAKQAARNGRALATPRSSAPKLAKKAKRRPKPGRAIATDNKPAPPDRPPVAAKRGRPRRAVEARPSGLTRIVIDHLTRLVAELVQEQRRLVADELEALLG